MNENEDLNDDLEEVSLAEDTSEDDIEIVDEDDESDDDGLAADDADAAPEEPAEAAAEASDDDDEDEDLSKFSPKVSDVIRTRLERERRKYEATVSEVAQDREKIRAAALHVANIAKSHEEELTAVKRQNAALQKHFAETLEYAYARDIESATAALRKAREDADYDAEVKAESHLAELRHTMQQIRQQKSQLPDPESIPPVRTLETTPVNLPPQVQKPATPPAPKAVEWLKRNKTWFFSQDYAGIVEEVKAIDNKVANEGYNKNSDEYYKELDRRIDKRFPALRKRKTGGGSPVAPASSAPARNVSKNTVVIGKQDKINMRRWGLDPANKEHLREYARNKRASA